MPQEKNTNEKKQTVKTVLLLLLFFIGLILATVGGYGIYRHFNPIQMPQASIPVATAPSKPSATTNEPVVELPDNPKDFAALSQQYKGIVGWISIPGTRMDFPIMQSTDDMPENYFLNHRPDGSEHKEGSIYMQKINQADFSDPNTVLYGHNMANWGMFAELHKFKKADFFNEHQDIYVYRPGMVLHYRIYSIFIYDDRHILNSFNFYNKEEYNTYLQYTLNPTSMTRQVREGVEVTTEDYILTLSTCTNYTKNERLIMEGVLIDAWATK